MSGAGEQADEGEFRLLARLHNLRQKLVYGTAAYKADMAERQRLQGIIDQQAAEIIQLKNDAATARTFLAMYERGEASAAKAREVTR